MLRPIALPTAPSTSASSVLHGRPSDDWQTLDAAGARDALAWLSLSARGEPVDVDRDICRLALISVDEPSEPVFPARRLM